MQWMESDNPSEMAIGHPCAFARAHMHDPFVVQTIATYNRLREHKNDLFSRGDYIEAWKVLVQLREMEKQLESYCFPASANRRA
jgi:hypothetical protein